MGYVKCMFAVILIAFTLGQIEGDKPSKCTNEETKTVNDCLQTFASAAFANSFIEKPCILEKPMCKASVEVATCINGDKTITNKCRRVLEKYIDQELAETKIKCTLAKIEDQCPKAKLNTGCAPQQVVVSLFCLLVSLLAGLNYTS